MTDNLSAKIKAIAPWFGGKRTLAPAIVAELGKHTQYLEPFCGSMAVLFAKEPSQKETVSDLHGDLINLARVLQDPPAAEVLYARLQSTLFSEDLLERAKYELDESTAMPDRGITPTMCERAYWYFLASWMGRNGTAGTARVDYQIAVRWTKNGGSPTVRWRNAVESIPWWHHRLLNVVILRRDAFKIIDRFEDVPQTAIYVDAPYHEVTRSAGAVKNGRGGKYLYEFNHHSPMFGNDHERLAGILRGYRKARIVVSYYDCQEIRKLYDGWTFVEHTRRRHLPMMANSFSRTTDEGRGAKYDDAPEILIINGPSYSGGG